MCRRYGERPSKERRELLWGEDRGMLVVQARVPVAEGEALLEAVRSVRDRMHEQATPDIVDGSVGRGEDPLAEAVDDSAEAIGVSSREPAADEAVAPPAPPSFSATMADALVALGKSSLAGGRSGSGESRPELVVHIDAETLAADAPGRCETAGGQAMCAETARRLGCDAGLVAVHRRDGRALSVGRRSRTIPAHIRRVIEARDRGCRFPGCDRRRYLPHTAPAAHPAASRSPTAAPDSTSIPPPP